MRRVNFTRQITRTLFSPNCQQMLNSEAMWSSFEKELRSEITLDSCVLKLRYLLNYYDHESGYDPYGRKTWSWDYWNAVFYSWSLLTTIGRG